MSVLREYRRRILLRAIVIGFSTIGVWYFISPETKLSFFVSAVLVIGFEWMTLNVILIKKIYPLTLFVDEWFGRGSFSHSFFYFSFYFVFWSSIFFIMYKNWILGIAY